jgi:HAD superfamily hydrolase (TIGR01509 family)
LRTFPGISIRYGQRVAQGGVRVREPILVSGAPPDRGRFIHFHSTLVDQGDGDAWIRLAWQHAGRGDDPVKALGAEKASRLARWMERLWDTAREVDPESRRDLDAHSHRDVYHILVKDLPEVDDELARSLYATMLETWIPYEDTIPLLRALHCRGIKTALVSNVGIDVRDVLNRAGLTDLLDAVVLSYEAGVVKPHTTIFSQALDLIGVTPERALMVGDSWRDDAGAAQLGIRTLLLPRTSGPTHGLDMVLRLVGAELTT